LTTEEYPKTKKNPQKKEEQEKEVELQQQRRERQRERTTKVVVEKPLQKKHPNNWVTENS